MYTETLPCKCSKIFKSHCRRNIALRSFSPFPQVLRSNSLLESTDYWLQNQRTPCQIGFVEDKSENTICASVSKPNSGCRLRKQGICRRCSAMDSSFLTG